MKKIGVYTAYDPKMDLQQHGLGRLLIFLLKGLIATGYTPVIAVPSWYIDDIMKFLRENHLDKQVELFYATNNPPVILQIVDFYSPHIMIHSNQKAKLIFGRFIPAILHIVNILLPGRTKGIHKSKFSLENLIAEFKKSINLFFFSIAATNSWTIAIISGLLFLAILPFLIMGGLLWLLIKLFFSSLKKILNYLIIFLNKISGQQINKIITSVSSRNFKALKVFPLVQSVRNAYRQRELPALIKKINTSNIEKWIVPTVFWEESASIKKPKVTVVPDLVYLSFPLHMCDSYGIAQRVHIINNILAGNSSFITYSRFIKEQQLIKHCDIDPESVTVVPHAAMDFSIYIKPDILEKTFTSLKCGPYQHLANYDFNSFDYIIYPSQMRPYKNILTLIQACHKLIMKKYCNIKLVLTMNNPESIINCIKDNNMTNNVIFAPDLNDAQLAALYHSAKLTVNPTLCEGGFPFTFTESYSVGTPSIMSKIPVTEEYVSGKLADTMLFDPYNVDDMIRKIHWGLLHHDELLNAQKKLYAGLKTRNWKDVAAEYVGAIR
jgi:glycosyltransferase involved in cell wall biosynthesis